MQAQDIAKLMPRLLPSPHRQKQATAAPAQSRKYLPIHWLENYEPVNTQFSRFQVEFEAAIAVRPSNPRFQGGDLPNAIMACPQGLSLKAKIGPDIQQVEIWVVGSRAATVSALDEQGHCVAIAQTAKPIRHPDELAYPAQSVVVDTHSACALRIDSKFPFLLTRLALHTA